MLHKKTVFLLILFLFFGLYSLRAQLTTRDSIDKLIDTHDFQSLADRKDTYEKALALIRKEADKEEEMAVLFKVINHSKSAGAYPLTLDYILQAKQLIETHQLEHHNGKIWISEGSTYSFLEQWEKADSIFRKGLSFYQLRKDTNKIVSLLNRRGMIESNQKRLDEGIAHFEEALSMLDGNEEHKALLQTLSNLAVIYFYKKDYQKALNSFKMVSIPIKKLGDELNIARNLENLAHTYGKLQQYPTAFIYFDSCIAMAKANAYQQLEYGAYHDRSEIYSDKGDFKNALKDYEKYHQLHEKVIGEKTQKKIAEIENKYQLELQNQKLKENEDQIQNLQRQASIRKQRGWIFLVGLIGLITILSILYFKSQSDAKKNQELATAKNKLIEQDLKTQELERLRLEEQLDFQKKDLTNLALDIQRKNDFSAAFAKRFNELENQLPTQHHPRLRDMQLLLNNHLQINEDQGLFQQNIDQINQDFYQKLEQHTNNLSPLEKQLCGLIRLNMSNKEIAILRNISDKSAKMSRYRLRKKLRLLPEDDIVTFLQSL